MGPLIGNLISYAGLLDHVAEIQKQGGKYVFRGQGNASWGLVPSIYRGIETLRPPADPFEDSFWLGQIERDVYREFEKASPGVWSVGVDRGDRWTKLFVAQHYGVPTRLLDWTSTLQVAVHCAASSNDEAPGSLWVLDVSTLPAPKLLGAMPRQAYGFPMAAIEEHFPIDGLHFFDPYSKDVSSGEPVRSEPPQSVFSTRQIEIKDHCGWLLLIEPPHLFPRIVHQRGLFSVYLSNDDDDIVWDHEWYLRQMERLRGGTNLWKVVIPADAKALILKGLMTSGFDHLAMYPDIEGLSQKLRFQRQQSWKDHEGHR